MIIDAAEEIIKHGEQIAHIGHSDRHDIHHYYFDSDPKCPHPLCRDARERLEVMRAELERMREKVAQLA